MAREERETREVTPWRPFSEMARMEGEMERLFDDFFNGRRGPWWRRWRAPERLRATVPAVDLYEEKDEIVAKAELPGLEVEYPQFAEQMRKIIASEEEHVRWLQEKILELGGEVPEVPSMNGTGRNMWEFFSKDLGDEGRSIADLEEAELAARRIDPHIADALRRMREDEERHRELIMDMLMRSDPQAHLSR